MNKKLKDVIAVAVIGLLILSGCTTVQRTVDYSKMQTDVAMSETIFITPTDAPKTIYIKANNTSSYQAASSLFEQGLTSSVLAKGYRVVPTVAEATYILQANIRYVGEYKENLNFEGSATGAIAGAMSGIGLTSPKNNVGGAVIGGLAGAAIGMAVDLATRPKIAVAAIDFRLTERVSKEQDIIGQEVEQTTITTSTQSTGGIGSKPNPPATTTTIKSVSGGGKGETKVHTAGVAAKAIQIGLNMDEAMQKLISVAATQIAGIF